jgi:hypothetical protein
MPMKLTYRHHFHAELDKGIRTNELVQSGDHVQRKLVFFGTRLQLLRWKLQNIEPAVVERFLRGGSLDHALGQAAGDEVLRRCAHGAEERVIELPFASFHALKSVRVCLPVERGRSRQEHVCDDSDGPDVAFLVV